MIQHDYGSWTIMGQDSKNFVPQLAHGCQIMSSLGVLPTLEVTDCGWNSHGVSFPATPP